MPRLIFDRNIRRNRLQEPWTAILMRVEGGSIGNADSANGALSTSTVAGFCAGRDLGVKSDIGSDLEIFWRPWALQALYSVLRLSWCFGSLSNRQLEILVGRDSGAECVRTTYHSHWRRKLPLETHTTTRVRGWRTIQVRTRSSRTSTPLCHSRYRLCRLFRASCSKVPAGQSPQSIHSASQSHSSDANSYKAIGYLGLETLDRYLEQFLCNYERLHPRHIQPKHTTAKPQLF